MLSETSWNNCSYNSSLIIEEKHFAPSQISHHFIYRYIPRGDDFYNKKNTKAIIHGN